MSSSSWAGYGPSTSTQGPSTIAPVLSRGGSAERQKKPQTRQLLSCTKCRERKVKVSQSPSHSMTSQTDTSNSATARNHVLHVVQEVIRKNASSSSEKGMITVPFSNPTRFANFATKIRDCDRDCKSLACHNRARRTKMMARRIKRRRSRCREQRQDNDASRREKELTTSTSERLVWRPSSPM